MSEALEEKSRRRRKRRSEEEPTEQEEVPETRGITEGKGRATPGRRSGGGERAESRGFLGGITEYFQGVREEVDKVVWPDREELIRLSRIVLLVTVASAIALGVISFLFTELFIFGFDDNEWIFGVIFAVVIGVAVAFQRMTSRDHTSPY